MKYDTGFQAAIASVLGSGQQSAKVTFVRCLQKKQNSLVFENILVLTFFLRIGEEGATVENQVLFLTIKID